jgi:hypothetical protein
MIRLLLRAAEWLDRRFPPKVVVTQESYDAMQEKLHKHNKELARLGGENLAERGRIDALEKSLAAIKDGIANGKVPTGAVKDRLRDEFVSGRGEAWAGRPQAPAAPPVVEEAR